MAENLNAGSVHIMPLDDGPKGYRMFKDKKEDGCVRTVFRPGR